MEAMLYPFRKKKVDKTLLSSLLVDGKNINKQWRFSGKNTSMQVKSELANDKKNYVEITCDTPVSLSFSNILDFSKENMYRFSFNLKGKADNIKKGTVNVRVIYLNISEKKIDNRCYNWFYFRPSNNWEQKNIIIISPDNKNPWNKAEITIFFDPGQYDVGDMQLETW